MDKKPLIVVSILAVVLLVMGSLSNVVGYQIKYITEGNDTLLSNISIGNIATEQPSLVGIPNDWWPMFGHDQNHSHYSTSTAPKINKLLWSYNTGDSVMQSSPAVVDGKVYVKTITNIICVNASSGGFEWSYPIEYWSDSSLAVAYGNVYFGSGQGNCTVYCLDAYSGDLIWSYFIGENAWVDSSPAVTDGRVYVGASQVGEYGEWGKLYCFDALTGYLNWSYAIGIGCWVQSSPAVAEGAVYVGVVDVFHQGGRVICLDASSGGFIWSYNITYAAVYSSPAVADGKVYVGFFNSMNVSCLDAYSGDLIWSHPTNSDVSSSPAVAYGKVYVGSWDYNVYCLDAYSGGLIWSYTTGDSVLSSPSIADGKIYIGSLDNKLYCLDAYSGGLIWSYTTGAPLASSPAIANGCVYMASDDNILYVFGGNNSPPTPPIIQGPTSGKIRKPVNYSICSTDPDEDSVFYYIDWGDGIDSGWIGPYAFGEEITQSHTWKKKGTYTIKAKAKDIYGNESNWGELSVTMPYSYEPQFPFLNWLLERFPYAFPILRFLLEFNH